jgi:excinuclease ABC subunit B
MNQTIYVSATPGEWEIREAGGEIVEQVIRPTGLLDPKIETRPAQNQVDDVLDEIREEVRRGGKVLVTTLTKRLSEELTTYLTDLDVKAKYLHSDIDTIERIQIIQDLRAGAFDVLVGINLLREGLDIPEVSFVAILDADKEGFLRSETSLIQTCGRAARNVNGRVIMYCDVMTRSIRQTIAITEERRSKQEQYNREHGIIPTSVRREIVPLVIPEKEEAAVSQREPSGLKEADLAHEHMTADEVREKISFYQSEMKQAAKELRFEDAAHFRDLMKKYQKIELALC